MARGSSRYSGIFHSLASKIKEASGIAEKEQVYRDEARAMSTHELEAAVRRYDLSTPGKRANKASEFFRYLITPIRIIQAREELTERRKRETHPLL